MRTMSTEHGGVGAAVQNVVRILILGVVRGRVAVASAHAGRGPRRQHGLPLGRQAEVAPGRVAFLRLVTGSGHLTI